MKLLTVTLCFKTGGISTWFVQKGT